MQSRKFRAIFLICYLYKNALFLSSSLSNIDDGHGAVFMSMWKNEEVEAEW